MERFVAGWVPFNGASRAPAAVIDASLIMSDHRAEVNEAHESGAEIDTERPGSLGPTTIEMQLNDQKDAPPIIP